MTSTSVKAPMAAAGRWTIDTTHSFVLFTVDHYTVAHANGIAAGPTGAIIIAENLVDSSCDAVIDARTFTTANPNRDERLRGPELLDVDKYPTITFVSTGLTTGPENRFTMDGDLTVHGITKSVRLDITFNGVIVDPKGKTRMGLTATAELRRDEFGLGDWGNVPLSDGRFMVPHLVRITLDIEAIQDNPAAS